MLSDRRQLILRALIEEYIACAMPVGSRALVERYNLGVSSATVRNELSFLEEMGYLAQPHTSAGRVPTDFGYRAFVDDLLSREDFAADESLVDELRCAAGDLDDLFDKTSAALSRFTDCMTLLVPPRFLSVNIHLVNLVLLAPQRLVAVVVAEDGQVLNRQIELPRECTNEEAMRTQELLNRLLSGRCISTVSESLPFDVDVKEVHDDLFRLVMAEIFACLKEQGTVKGHPLGMSHLLGKPEFSDSSCLMPVLEELEGDTMLVRVFEEAMGQDAPVVRIGHENDSEALSSVSLIANRFGGKEHSGLILIVGPTRMDYSQVLKAVRAARSILKDK